MAKKWVVLAVPVSLYLIIWTSYSFFLEIPFNAKRLAEGFLLLWGAILVCTSKTFQKKWIFIFKTIKANSIIITSSLTALFLVGLISAAFSDYPHYAFLEVGHFFLLFNLILLCVIGYLYRPSYFEYGLLSVIGLLPGLYLVNVAVSYLYTFFVPDFPLWPSTDFIRLWFEGIGFRYPEPFLNFVHVRFLNHIQTWTLPLITLLILRIPIRYWAFQKIAFIIACGWWMLVFAADARGTMLASLIALGFVFIIYRKKAWQWLKTHSLAAVSGLGLYLLFFKLLPLNGEGGRTILSRYGDSGRFKMWEYALDLAFQNPFLGVGPMHFAVLNPYINFAGPHNAYIQVLSEWGIPAGILFLAVIGISSYKWFISSNKVIYSSIPDSNKVNIRVALTASLLAALTHAFFTNSLNTPLSQIVMVLVLAWMIGLSLSKDSLGTSKQLRPYLRYLLVSLNVLAAGFLIWSYIMQVPNLDQNRKIYIEKTGSNTLYPRYWDQGIIGIQSHKDKPELRGKNE